MCAVAPPRADDAALIDRCVMDLTAHGVPVLVLAGAGRAPSCASSMTEASACWGGRVQPLVVAAMLAALWQRQTFVQSISRELALALRCQSGIRTEIERIHEELQLAANFQQEFTATPMPRLAGLDFAALFRPVSAVSGDIYCVRTVAPDTAAFFLADAVGHGVPVMLLTMVLTNSLVAADEASREVCGRTCHTEPGEVLARLNRRLIEGSLGNGRFATAVYGTMNVHAGSGHLRRGAPAPARALPQRPASHRDGWPVAGRLPGWSVGQSTTVLAPGETLVLHTDGLEAAFAGDSHRKGNPFIDELSTAFRPDDVTAREALDELELLIDDQYGSLHQQDDVTVVAIRATSDVIAKAA